MSKFSTTLVHLTRTLPGPFKVRLRSSHPLSLLSSLGLPLKSEGDVPTLLPDRLFPVRVPTLGLRQPETARQGCPLTPVRTPSSEVRIPVSYDPSGV